MAVAARPLAKSCVTRALPGSSGTSLLRDERAHEVERARRVVAEEGEVSLVVDQLTPEGVEKRRVEERGRHVVDDGIGAGGELRSERRDLFHRRRGPREEGVVHEEREALAREGDSVADTVERHRANGGGVVGLRVFFGERGADGGDEAVAPVHAEALVRLDEEIRAVRVGDRRQELRRIGLEGDREQVHPNARVLALVSPHHEDERPFLVPAVRVPAARRAPLLSPRGRTRRA